MFADWYHPNVQLDYPIGGSSALVDALVEGLNKHGSKLVLNANFRFSRKPPCCGSATAEW
jgi:phytoene dehydrogenase-like protein